MSNQETRQEAQIERFKQIAATSIPEGEARKHGLTNSELGFILHNYLGGLPITTIERNIHKHVIQPLVALRETGVIPTYRNDIYNIIREFHTSGLDIATIAKQTSYPTKMIELVLSVPDMRDSISELSHDWMLFTPKRTIFNRFQEIFCSLYSASVFFLSNPPTHLVLPMVSFWQYQDFPILYGSNDPPS